MLRGILERLEATEVHGPLELGGIAAHAVGLDRGGNEASPPGSTKRLDDTPIGQEWWVDSSRECANLIECLFQLRSEFEIEPRPDGGSTIRQTAIFEPSGPAGWAYWIALYPVHALIFRGMLRAIARQAAAPAARPFPIRPRVHPQNPAT